MSPFLVAAPGPEALLFFGDAAADLLRAAEGDYDSLLAEIEQVFSAAIGARRATVLLRTGGADWQSRADLRCAEISVRSRPALDERVLRSAACVHVADGLFVPIREREVAVLVEGETLRSDALDVVTSLARVAELALRLCERSESARRAHDEIDVLQQLSSRIMRSRDLEEILLRTTHEAQRLLAADICGIMLRECGEIVMRHCVGNHAPETAALRMRPGQGVAGRVFATLEPCLVSDYLASDDAISTDFFPLARAEKVRSALAAPILSEGEIIGVLEVWRRRPFIFMAEDSQRLAALASLMSTAIDNARSYATLQTSMNDLGTAHRQLTTRCERRESASDFQEELMNVLLEEHSLAGVAARAAAHVGCDVLVVDERFDLHVASAGLEAKVEERRVAIAALVAGRGTLEGAALVRGRLGDDTLLVRPVLSGPARCGWVAFVCAREVDEHDDLALRHVATAAALHHAEQRSGSLARAETLEALTWELLEAKEEARRAALSRVREMRVPVDQPLRVVLCSLVPSRESAETIAPGRLRDLCRQPDGLGDKVLLCAQRGEKVACVIASVDAAEADRLGQRLLARLAQELPDVKTSVGISSACARPLDLPLSAREARIALDVAARRHPRRVAVYEQVGIVGLLLSLREDGDLSRVVDSTLGKLLALAPPVREPLIETLRTFFATNCSQQATAECLGIHPKTVSHRLGKLAEVTGLDLTSHEDRLLADIALRLMELLGAPKAG